MMVASPAGLSRGWEMPWPAHDRRCHADETSISSMIFGAVDAICMFYQFGPRRTRKEIFFVTYSFLEEEI